jgi:hypothetical protein
MELHNNNLNLDELCDLTVEKLFSIYKSDLPYLSIATFLDHMEHPDDNIEDTSICISNRLSKLGLVNVKKNDDNIVILTRNDRRKWLIFSIY